MIDDLIRGLAAGSDLSAEEILDVLWLSAIRAGPRSAGAVSAPAGHEDPERPLAPHPAAPSPPARGDEGEGGDADIEEEDAAGVSLRLPAGDGPDVTGAGPAVELMPATEVGFGAPRPIRDAAALPRALRRLRQVRRPGPRLAVDVDATVDATAEAGGTLVPVFTRPAERALDLALVVDGAPAMRIWDDTFDELARLMAQTGAFRSVERWRLITDDAGGAVSLADASGKVQPTDRLIDPSGRRLVFVATSASADAWYTLGPWEAIASWAAAMPTALIQMLPRQYWAGTALGEPYVTARASRPAAPNAEYTHRLAWWADDPGGVPLPVVTLSPDALETWAQAVVSGTAWTTGITATPPDPEYAPSAAESDADVLVNDFLARASPGAERLARILATASTLSMPLIAVLQESLAPETGVLELAEVLSSGLLPVDGAFSGAAGQPRFRFRFRDDTRQLLRRGVTTFEEWDAYAAVSAYLESRHQLGGPLSALLPDPSGSAVLDPADEPFAALHESLATRLGLRTLPGTEPDHPDNFGEGELPADEAESPSGDEATENPEAPVPEDLLALLVDCISGLHTGRGALTIVAFDATSAVFSRIERDRHGTPAYHPAGTIRWDNDPLGETIPVPGARAITAANPNLPIVLIHKPGAHPSFDDLVSAARLRSDASTSVREYHFDGDVLRAIREAIARSPIAAAYELVALHQTESGELRPDNVPLFPSGAAEGALVQVVITCPPSDDHGTVLALLSFPDRVPAPPGTAVITRDLEPRDDPMLVTSAKVPPGRYILTAELLSPGAVRLTGLPAEPRPDPRPWREIMATVPERVQPLQPAHLIFAIEADAPGPVMDGRFSAAEAVINAVENTGTQVSVSIVLYGWQSAPGFASASSPMWLAWRVGITQALAALGGSPILLAASPGQHSDIDKALQLIADRLDSDPSEGQVALVTIGLRSPTRYWRRQFDRLVAQEPDLVLGAIMDKKETADAPVFVPHEWGTLGRNASALISNSNLRQFAVGLGLTAPSPTPVPFPLDPTPGIIMDGTRVADSPAPTEAPVPPQAEIARDQGYQLRSAVLRIGRSPDNDVVVPDLTVSKHHAELRLRLAGIAEALRGDGGPWLEINDLGSTNGTFLNDVRVRSGVVSSRSIITIGNSTFRMAGGELYEERPGGISLTVRDLRRWVPTARAPAGRALEQAMADGISFSLAERSMLLVVGPLGSGKTALCDALTGQRIDDGHVLYNGRDLSEYADAFESRTGLVPQRPSEFNIGSPRPYPMGALRSLARRTLQGRPTSRSVLRNAAGQRFARDTSEAERDRRIGQVLVDATLAVHADVRLDGMLPHERKRVDIGLALLTDPAILFLDEPFAALQPSYARDMFAELRAMADPTSTAGRTVVVFVKDTDPVPVELSDRLLVLISDGTVAYYGPPVEGLRYFGKEDWAEVYQMFQDEPARNFAAEFRASPQYARYVIAPMSGPEP